MGPQALSAQQLYEACTEVSTLVKSSGAHICGEGGLGGCAGVNCEVFVGGGRGRGSRGGGGGAGTTWGPGVNEDLTQRR